MAKKVHREPQMIDEVFSNSFLSLHKLFFSTLLLINFSSSPPHFLHLTLSRSLYISINLCLASRSQHLWEIWWTRMSSSPTEKPSWVRKPSLSLTLPCSLLLPLTLPFLVISSWSFSKQPIKTATTSTRTILVLVRLHLGSIPCVILLLHVSDPLHVTLCQTTTIKHLGSYVNLYVYHESRLPISRFWYLIVVSFFFV